MGKIFIDRYLPGNLKGLLPFSIFVLTFSTLGLIEAISLNLRVNEYLQLCENISNDLQAFKEVPLTVPNLAEFNKILVEITKIPRENPSTGIISDISRWIIKKFSYISI